MRTSPIFTLALLALVVTMIAIPTFAWEPLAAARKVPSPANPNPNATPDSTSATATPQAEAAADASAPSAPAPAPSATSGASSDGAPAAPSTTSDASAGDAFLAALQEYMNKYEGATEHDGKFEELFPHEALSRTRIEHARIKRSYTTCIDTQGKLTGLALAKSKTELVAQVNSKLATRVTRDKLNLPAGAWHEVVHELLPQVYKKGMMQLDPKRKPVPFAPHPNTTYVDPRLPDSPRPKQGDVYVFVFYNDVKDDKGVITNGAGSFSHMGFVKSVKPAATGTTLETWRTYDGGAGKAPKYDIAVVGKPGAPIKSEWFLWGTEAIKVGERQWDTSINKFPDGVDGQGGKGRALLGWVAMDKMVRPNAVKPSPAGGKVSPKLKGVASAAKAAAAKTASPAE